MSPEIVESVFKFSELKGEEMMLISSKNQIDWDRGYVNAWNTKEYGLFIDKMKKKYQKAEVFICRDHCGPGFKNDDLKDVYQTINTDIEAGFDLIHIDFCHYKGTKREKIEASKNALAYIKNLSPQTLL